MKKSFLLSTFLILFTSLSAIATPLEDYIYTGKSYHSSKDYDNAINYFKKAVQEDSNDPEANYLLAKAYYAKKDYINAKYYFNRYSSLDPSQYTYIKNLLAKIEDEQTRPATPPELTSIVSFVESTNKGYLNAGDTGNLFVKVKNTGKDSAKNLTVKITSEKNIPDLRFNTEEIINEIKSNKEVEIKIPITASQNILDNEVKLKIEVIEPFYGADADTYKLSFMTRAIRPPELVVTDYGLEEETGGVIPKGKSVIISAVIKNQGKGTSYNTSAFIKSNSKYVSILEGNSFDLGELGIGQAKKISFTIFVNKKADISDLPFDIEINNKIVKFNKIESIKLALDKADKVKEVTITPTYIKEELIYNDNISVNVDVDTNIPKISKENKNAIAIIIGNSNYKDKDIKTVQYAINDAKIVKEYVKNSLGYREGNIIFEPDATQSTFNDLFGTKEDHNGKLASLIKENQSDVFIYYSGHGAPDDKGSAYFVPTDANQERIKLLGYPLETFYDNLNKLKAKSITVVLDSCFSGGEIIKGASPIYLSVKNVSNIGNVNVLTSSSNKQLSSWYDEKKHSMFTYYFLKAIQLGNKEDEDGDRPTNRMDGKLTLGDIHNYVFNKVKYMANRLYRRQQEPQIYGKKDKLISEN